jgi:hypothetical protein
MCVIHEDADMICVIQHDADIVPSPITNNIEVNICQRWIAAILSQGLSRNGSLCDGVGRSASESSLGPRAKPVLPWNSERAAQAGSGIQDSVVASNSSPSPVVSEMTNTLKPRCQTVTQSDR